LACVPFPGIRLGASRLATAEHSGFRAEKYFKNVIASQACLLVEICPAGGTKIFIDVATQL
jgi:hypothetical protein